MCLFDISEPPQAEKKLLKEIYSHFPPLQEIIDYQVLTWIARQGEHVRLDNVDVDVRHVGEVQGVGDIVQVLCDVTKQFLANFGLSVVLVKR